MLRGIRSRAHQLLSQVFINCSILILVRQSLAFCKFTGQGRDLISLLNLLLRYCRSPCSTVNTFWLFFLCICLFSLVCLITIGLVLQWKNVNRRILSAKSFKNRLSVSTTLFNFLTNSSDFFYCVTLFFIVQCNSRWNTNNHSPSEKKEQKLINTNVITRHNTIAMSRD